MIYLDNSATTKPYHQVAERVVYYMTEAFGNPSSLHHLGFVAEKAVKTARQQISAALNSTTQRVIFTSGGTEADNLAVIGCAMANRRSGDHIITTKIEHPAVLEACRHLEKIGFRVDYLPVDKDGVIDIKTLGGLVTDRTILISVMHVNNETGSIQPVEQIDGIKRNALTHLDCVQSFGKLPISADWADLISTSGHKIHGPKGTGSLCVGKTVRLFPQMLGGGQEKTLRSGTENVPSLAGYGLAAEMAAVGLEERGKKVAILKEFLKKGIVESIPDVLVNSPLNSSPFILNVSFLGTRGEVLLHRLEQGGIYVSTGSACSSNKKEKSHVLAAMGRTYKEIDGALRFSFSEFNTLEEMEFVLDTLTKGVAQFRKLGSFR